ncbi:MAG TPA: hypothetical protein VFR23_24885 [Jiangellaceae bacterium]|nr:hypothetical protein [Jiangellaceae bacterium]
MSLKTRGLDRSIRPAADYALAVAAHYGIPVTVTSGKRSWAEQVRLRKQFESCLARGERVHPGNPNAACRWPANRPGDSSHNYGLAFDSWVPDQYWPAWNYIRRAVGFAVPEHDRIHAEYPQWRSVVD